MMDDLDFIIGLMREDYDAVGFIPATTIEHRYLADNRYVIQTDRQGRRLGYILHGKPTAGGILTIAQHLIDYDFRERGYGREAFDVVKGRALEAGCRAIRLHCAEDLASNLFWRAMGFEHVHTLTPDNKRRRAINVYWLDLWPSLWGREITRAKQE